MADAGLHQDAGGDAQLPQAAAEQLVLLGQQRRLVRRRIALRHQGHAEQRAGGHALLVLGQDVLAHRLEMVGVQRHDGIQMQLLFVHGMHPFLMICDGGRFGPPVFCNSIIFQPVPGVNPLFVGLSGARSAGLAPQELRRVVLFVAFLPFARLFLCGLPVDFSWKM